MARRTEGRIAMKKNVIEARELSEEELAFRKARRKNIVAFAVCVLIAFFLWLVIMNAEASVDGGGTEDPLPGSVLSVTGLE